MNGEEASRIGCRVAERAGGEVLEEGLGILERTLRIRSMEGGGEGEEG